MLIVETIARIRREHFIKGKTIKEIARDLKVSRNTVRKVLRSGETSFEYERAVQPRPKLGRWAAELDRVLAANATKAAREQLTLIRTTKSCAAAVTTVATMPCGVMPDDGVRTVDNRRLRPTSR